MKKIHTIVWKEDAWYVAKALEVEVASQGKSEQEALDNLKEALELYFEGNANIVGQKGSHIKLTKKQQGVSFTVIVPNHKEVALGTFQSILKQAGLTREEFEKYL